MFLFCVGVEVDVCDEDGWILFFYVCVCGDVDIVVILFLSGVDFYCMMVCDVCICGMEIFEGSRVEEIVYLFG